MHLDSYNDKELMMENVNEIVLVETENDNIDVFESANLGVDNATNIDVDSAIQEDLVQMKLKRNNNKGMPTYEATIDKGSKTNKSYKSTQFVKYQGAFIRKSTALYLLQENQVLSSDRLIRVREEKTSEMAIQAQEIVSSGDLCIFRRIDDTDKLIIGKIVQFSYLEGTKRQQEYSGLYVVLTKDYKSIGTFANWFVMFDSVVGNRI